MTDIDPDRLEQLIGSLVEKEILAVRSDRLSPERGQLQFTQNLLRSVAYDTLTRREKRIRHLAAATQLRSEFPDDGAEVADLIAAHYQAALDLVPDAPDSATVRTEAASAYRGPVTGRPTSGAPSAAFAAYTKAARLLEGTGNDLDVVAAAGRMAARSGDWATATDLLGQAAARLEKEGRDDDARALVAELVLVHEQWGHQEEALRLAQDALDRTPPDAAGPGTAALLQRVGKSLNFRGKHQAAAPVIERAIGISASLNDPELLAGALDAEAGRLWFSGQLVISRLVAEEAVEVSRTSGHLDRLVAHLSNLGDTLLNSDLPAVDVLRESVDVARRLGDRLGLSIASTNLVNALFFVGEWDEAMTVCSQTVEDEADYEGSGAGGLYDRLVLIHSRRGDLVAARENFERAGQLLAPEDFQDAGIHAAAGAALKLAEGDNAGVLDDIEHIATQGATVGWSGEAVRQLWPDAAEAALRDEDLESVERLVSMLQERPPGTVSPFLRAQLTRTHCATGGGERGA